ncbi:hypothetical protein SAMN05216207_1005109 [Pseudonocardia ammonioxydans]|uniref:Uncharacterized protein n=1 Tax=Pseudonocardia ammonioxydans TaxID=260086 RepID=A0A1I4V0U0_PSUAM|nr:hypothetical protein SAMN05216207_1005109 [Pseudonocardia ammonioxydans]
MTGNVRKILILVAVALGIFLVVTAPTAAAGSVQNVGNILYDAAQSVSTFVTSLI